MKKVIIYSTPSCVYCNMAKNFFKANNIAYAEYDVSSDADKRKEMIDMTGQMGVPAIDAAGEIIVGFDEPRLRQILSLSAGSSPTAETDTMMQAA